MKRLLLVFAMFAMALAFAACGDESDCDCDDGENSGSAEIGPDEICDLCDDDPRWCTAESGDDPDVDVTQPFPYEAICVAVAAEYSATDELFCQYLSSCLYFWVN